MQLKIYLFDDTYLSFTQVLFAVMKRVFIKELPPNEDIEVMLLFLEKQEELTLFKNNGYF
jgi:hypothetical protein